MVCLRPLRLAVGVVAALAVAGCGGGDNGADNGGDADKRAPAASGGGYATADLKRFVIAPSDLPDGYATQTRTASSSPASCLSDDGDEAATRALTRKFTALGFKSCAGASFRKKVSAGVTKTNRPAGQAILMRDEDAAAGALPVLRRALINSFTSTGSAGTFEPHSIPAPQLGDEAPRGVTLSGDLGPLLGSTTFYIYAWRRGNVLAWIGTADILGDFDARRTLELARKLDARGAR